MCTWIFELTEFNTLGLSQPLLRALSDENYVEATPIQSKVVPAMLAGRDILGTAQTGTGKTAAFVLPLLHRIHADAMRPEPKGCSALILAPTRELANQIADSVRTYGRYTRPSVAIVIGGAKAGQQVRAMAKGVDILVATPGRLLDLMGSGAIRIGATSSVVLDEADQMLDLGFMPAIRRILAALPKDRQTVLLSATMPKQIRALANDFLTAPESIAVAPVSRPIERIDQSVIHIDRGGKTGQLVALMRGEGVDRAIIFTRTKRGADKVCKTLQTAGIEASAIHGNKSQNQRERTLKAFRSGHVRALVATDIAARGIDIDDVSHVINFELPNVPESYVHRIGRTARAGRTGVAVSLCDASERPYLKDIEKLIGSPVPVRQREARPDDLPTPAAVAEAEREERQQRPQRPQSRPQSHSQSRKPNRKPRPSDSGRDPGRGPRRDRKADEAGLKQLLAEADSAPKRRRPRRRRKNNSGHAAS
jgi:ATP-dependent RNA helicase RhlE